MSMTVYCVKKRKKICLIEFYSEKNSRGDASTTNITERRSDHAHTQLLHLLLTLDCSRFLTKKKDLGLAGLKMQESLNPYGAHE
jgi:hypothetical protein